MTQMTQESKDKICQCCSAYAGCGFISRELQRKCNFFNVFEDCYEQGYKSAFAKAEEWLHETFSEREIYAGGYVNIEVYAPKCERFNELLDDFEKEMKGD